MPDESGDVIPTWIAPAAQAAEDAGRPAWSPAPSSESGRAVGPRLPDAGEAVTGYVGPMIVGQGERYSQRDRLTEPLNGCDAEESGWVG